jgi:hypothetical protein
LPTDPPTVALLNPQAPSTQSQSLATVNPEPGIEKEADQQEISTEEGIARQGIVRLERSAADHRNGQPHRQCGGNHQHSG